MEKTGPLQFSENTINITMKADGLWGNKGYDPSSDTPLIHNLFITSSTPKNEVNKDDVTGGPVPVRVSYGKKVPTYTLDGYFPYTYPDEFFEYVIEPLKNYRVKNTVKNIFLAGSILTVNDNGNGVFSEYPIGSKWYVKKYTWERSVESPQKGGFNLILMRWYK